MREDYIAASKLGDDAVKKAVAEGHSPYLPVLDQYLEGRNLAGETHVGLRELPMDFITGNKFESRNNAFANNFMPIFPDGTEFASKWSSLYDSCVIEGVRDAIKVYEYMNHYYVQEGNKRVSVSKYLHSEFILADVTRILPAKSEEKEVKVYYEFLEFNKCTGLFTIIFNEPGDYIRLAEIFGQTLNEEWTADAIDQVKSAFLRFVRAYTRVVKTSNAYTVGPAFLAYISIFSVKELLTRLNEDIVKNIRLAIGELTEKKDIEDIAFLSETPQKQSVLFRDIRNIRLLSYSSSNPLKVAFIYNNNVEASRWVDSHEAGRLYVEEMESDKVRTRCYYADKPDGDVSEAVYHAISDKNEVVFTISSYMMGATMQAALKTPNVRFLNCSVGRVQNSVRSYHGRLYEATFLMGILAASSLKDGDVRRIGYLADFPGKGSVANINAFALGAALIDPECRIDLKWSSVEADAGFREEWKQQGIRVFSDVDFLRVPDSLNRSGVYRIEGDKRIYLGTPFYSWGRYYDQIVRSVLTGTWSAKGLIHDDHPMSYWFGLNTGVVDILLGKDIPYQTRKLLEYFKRGIASGSFSPFSGEIRTGTGILQSPFTEKSTAVSMEMNSLSTENIVSMNWLAENVDGHIPEFGELIRQAQRFL